MSTEKPAVITKVACISDPETQLIIKPDSIDWNQASQFCATKAKEGESVTSTSNSWVAFPWVLAVAVETVLKSWSATKHDTRDIQVPGSDGRNRQCTWGIFAIAGLGTLGLDFHVNKKLRRPEIRATVTHPQKFAERAKELIDAIDAEVQKSVWLKGLALQLEVAENGDVDFFAPPRQVEIPNISEDDIILPDHLSRGIAARILFPLRNPNACRLAGVSVRRGSLLAGRPGTGKTMTARLATRVAVDNDWGVLYIPDSRALEQALNVAQAMAPCLVICEDIDRQLGGERDATTDRILNALDGLDRSKPVMLICTSNAPEMLPAPLLRAGRLDSILIFTPPDNAAARKLLLRHLEGMGPHWIENHECEGLLPSQIKEVAESAILYALAAGKTEVSREEVVACARMVRAQQDILERAENKPPVYPRIQLEMVSGEKQESASDRLTSVSQRIAEAGQDPLDGNGRLAGLPPVIEEVLESLNQD